MPLLLCAAVWLVLLAPPSFAADPIMPLEQVERGMQCEGRSVIRGTAIESFDVEILDVIAPSAGSGATILFRASGPAVDATGMGFGFSGSPIYCPDADGVLRNIGAVFAGVEDYGNDVALATPIEHMLSMPVSSPPQARRATRAERRAQPWSSPLMVSGAGPVVRRALWAAARRAGLQLIHAPAGASQVATGVELQPGSAVAAGMSTGSIGLNGIGTVAYRDDSGRIWAFGHPLDSAGRRSLLLQGAFVHAVIGNPNPPGLSLGTYKLASAGEVAGTVDFDGNFAISGTLGALPTTIPVVVRASGPAGAPLPASRTLVADESPLDHPGGLAALSLVSSIAVSDRVLTALGSSSGRSYGRLCMRIDLAERRKPLRFCNRYVGDGRFLGGLEIAMGGDAARAATLVERFDRSQLHVERVRATLEVEEGLRFARLRGASGPRRVRPGQRIRIRIRAQRPRSKIERHSFTMRVPRSLKPGLRTLRLTGTGPDPGNASLEAIFTAGLSAEDGGLGFGQPSPASVQKLAEAVSAIHRYDGIRGTFGKRRRRGRGGDDFVLFFDPLGTAAAGERLFRHERLRIGGRAKLRFRVLPRNNARGRR